uniref:Battenin n=2 Tax=Ixodes ricinus TaxID=34613 RepID=A0A090X9W9_IXORI
MTSFTVATWMSFMGVVCAAIGSGLGEITFLAYSAHFDKDVISTWSSGTGGAGVLGALSYAAMASVLSPEKTLLVMLFVPVLMAISFWGVLVHPKLRRDEKTADEAIPDEEPLLPCSGCTGYTKVTLTFGDKLRLIKPLLKFMIPLGLVYLAEYFINQGLLELIVFRNTKLSHKEQYRWLQVMYQVGVLISRSSVNFIQIRRLWILPILQFINVAFIFSEAYLLFSAELLDCGGGGALRGPPWEVSAYVNTFYRISQDVPIQHREFSLRIASLADSAGIAIAGAMALPTHDAMCRLNVLTSHTTVIPRWVRIFAQSSQHLHNRHHAGGQKS